MKNLRDYIAESEQWVDNPVAGDDFAINIREECLLESHIVDVTEDAVVIEADDRMLEMLESYGMLGEEELAEEIRRYGAAASNSSQGFSIAEADQAPVDYRDQQQPQHITGEAAVTETPDSLKISRILELAGLPVTEDEPIAAPQNANANDPLLGKAVDDAAVQPMEEGEDARGLDHAYEVHGNRHGYYVWRKSPISAILNIGITDPRLTGLTSWDPRSPGIQDYVNQHMKSVNFNSLSDDIKELIQTKLPLQQGKPEKSDSPPALSGTDKTQSPNQNLDRFRKLAGLAEEREDREWSKRELEALNKAGRDFERHLASVSTPDDRAFNANLVKKRMATNPLAGPKGRLPEQQGVAEGVMSDIDMDLRHIAKTERLDALVDALRGEFGPKTAQYLHDLMDEVDQDLKQRGMVTADMKKRLAMLMNRVQEIYHDQDLAEAEYRGRDVPLGKPMAGDVKKKKVYVRKPNGNVVKVEFGDKTMRIKKSNPKRRKSFRARHNCENPGPRWKARYWSCRAW